jgi:hypothetical protein
MAPGISIEEEWMSKDAKPAAASPTYGQTRYIVNPENGDVFIYTERLREAFPEFKEVFAKDAETAKVKRAMPEPRTVSMAQLEDMSKADLLLFARMKMDPVVEVEESMTKDEMLDHIKEALFTRVAPAAP